MHVVDYLRVAGTPNDLRVFAARSRRQKVDCTELLSFISDEQGKIPLARRGCLSFIIGSGVGRSSVPQNPGIGQKEYPDRNILGRGSRRGKSRK